MIASELGTVLRSKTARSVLVWLLPATLSVLFLIGFVFIDNTRDRLEADVRHGLENTAEQVRSTLSHRLDLMIDAATVIANNEILVGSLVDESSQTSYLPPFFTSLRMPVDGESHISLTDYRGRVLASTRKGQVNYTDAPWLGRVMGGLNIVQFGLDGLTLVVPVRYNGLPEGMLVVEFPASTEQRLLTLNAGDIAHAVAYKGQVLATSNPNLIKVGASDVFPGTSDWIRLYRGLPRYPGLNLIVGLPRTQAFSGIDEIIKTFLIAGVILAAGLIVTTLVTLGTVTRPLQRLTERVEHMRQADDLKQKIELEGPEEFQILADAFNTMTGRLLTSIEAQSAAEAASLAKSEFLSSMSHELRTPMNAILGFAQVLNGDPDQPLSDDQKESVDQILHSGEHLLELINEVLDLSKVEAGKLSLSIEAVDIKPVISECCTLVKAMANKRSIQLIDRTAGISLPAVQVDRTRFKQSLLNLMSNAVKYNHESGSVILEADLIDPDQLRLTIIDTGIGIPESEHDFIFQPFTRVTSSETNVEGTGIGLTITKRLIEFMGGEVGFTSREGVGSLFWIEVPQASDTAEESTSAFRTEQKPASGPARLDLIEEEGAFTVLYVEDNPANLKLMETIVRRVHGVKLLSTHTAELGIAVAAQKNPDLIFMDINLPGMDGFEALSRLKASPETAGIPVIAISANAMPRDIERGQAVGFDDYITKPIRITEISGILDKMRRAAEPT